MADNKIRINDLDVAESIENCDNLVIVLNRANAVNTKKTTLKDIVDFSMKSETITDLSDTLSATKKSVDSNINKLNILTTEVQDLSEEIERINTGGTAGGGEKIRNELNNVSVILSNDVKENRENIENISINQATVDTLSTVVSSLKTYNAINLSVDTPKIIMVKANEFEKDPSSSADNPPIYYNFNYKVDADSFIQINLLNKLIPNSDKYASIYNIYLLSSDTAEQYNNAASYSYTDDSFNYAYNILTLPVKANTYVKIRCNIGQEEYNGNLSENNNIIKIFQYKLASNGVLDINTVNNMITSYHSVENDIKSISSDSKDALEKTNLIASDFKTYCIDDDEKQELTDLNKGTIFNIVKLLSSEISNDSNLNSRYEGKLNIEGTSQFIKIDETEIIANKIYATKDIAQLNFEFGITDENRQKTLNLSTVLGNTSSPDSSDWNYIFANVDNDNDNICLYPQITTILPCLIEGFTNYDIDDINEVDNKWYGIGKCILYPKTTELGGQIKIFFNTFSFYRKNKYPVLIDNDFKSPYPWNDSSIEHANKNAMANYITHFQVAGTYILSNNN